MKKKYWMKIRRTHILRVFLLPVPMQRQYRNLLRSRKLIATSLMKTEQTILPVKMTTMNRSLSAGLRCHPPSESVSIFKAIHRPSTLKSLGAITQRILKLKNPKMKRAKALPLIPEFQWEKLSKSTLPNLPKARNTPWFVTRMFISM